MEVRTKVIIFIITVSIILILVAGILVVVYGLPRMIKHDINIKNVREDQKSTSYTINNGSKNSISYNETQKTAISNGSVIQDTTSGAKLQVSFGSLISGDIIKNIYLFNSSIQTNLTTVNLQIQNESSITYYIWEMPSQTPASVAFIEPGKNVNMYSYINQQLAFSTTSTITEGGQIYFFTPTSIYITILTLTDNGIMV